MGSVHLSGSCLCGSVAYEVEGDAKGFYHCHCERCRKATGTGHASNILLTDAAVKWTAGEALVTRYKLPEARRFSTAFCRVCGSNLPRIAPETTLVVVPAGSLDSDPGLAPQAHIFDGSRAVWSCDGRLLPRHAAYP